jgi:hypothetical protein
VRGNEKTTAGLTYLLGGVNSEVNPLPFWKAANDSNQLAFEGEQTK